MDEVVGVGVDCESISRFRGLNDLFFEKNFTENERKYCLGKPDPFQHFAARFAAKEAIMKAFSAAGESVFFSDIEILRKDNGIPYARITREPAPGLRINLSISHSSDMAIAFAVVTK